MMYIYGKNVIKEAILNQRKIFNLYLDEKLNDYQFKKFLVDHHISFEFRSKGDLNNLTKNALHQGVVAHVEDYQYQDLESLLDKNKKQRFLILDGIEDPHNLGAILRTAEATRLDAVILSKKQQVPLNATVAKVASGALEHVPVVLVSNINQAILKLQEAFVCVIGTDGSATANYRDLPLEQSLAVVLGNEGEGIRPLVRKNCDLLVKIPMYGKINILNVSVAAALMMYANIKVK
jgi:23S rRNA (guanosine2251-2'-O)-methyltransferase